MHHDEETRDRLAAEVARFAISTGRTIAVAESLTGGLLAAALAAAESSSTWFRGGLVAYAGEVKHSLLAVPPGPVVTAGAAHAMATAVRELLDADVAVAVTGAGGPEPQDGQDPGTVFLAVTDGSASESDTVCRELEGDPGEVCRATVVEALDLLVERLRLPAASSTGPVGSG